MLLPFLAAPPDGEAIRVGDQTIGYPQLRAAALALAARLAGSERVAVWAAPGVETCVGVVAGLAAGTALVPLNPASGQRELEHVVADSGVTSILARAEDELPPALAALERELPDLGAAADDPPPEPDPEAPALVLYTSGTTGPPKGAVIPRRAVASNLDALAEVWEWTAADRLVHGLPLFHVHGLVLGILGPLRLGGRVHHVGRFSPGAVADALRAGGTMLFGVPTMYHRLAAAAEADVDVAGALAGARVLVSGSAPLPVREHARIETATGRRVVERYGLTETIINCSIRVSGEPRPGSVGPPLPGVELRLLDDDGRPLDAFDGETIGEVAIRGPNVFSGYLNLPEATERAVRGGWFLTGDLATRSADGYVRIVGRRATDLIKTGGYKVGAGEVEAALLEHPAVAEAAVAGLPDDDLGERIVAWVVPRGASPEPDALARHVSGLLSPHKRPREIRFLPELPRNAMGKVLKERLRAT